MMDVIVNSGGERNVSRRITDLTVGDSGLYSGMKPTLIALGRLAILAAIVCGSISWHKAPKPVVCTAKCPNGTVYTLTVIQK
jgi:hypothetical protein